MGSYRLIFVYVFYLLFNNIFASVAYLSTKSVMPSNLIKNGVVMPKVWATRGRVTKLRLQLLDPRNPQVTIAYSFTDPARVPAQVQDILTLPVELRGIDHAMLRLSDMLTNQVATYMATPTLWNAVSCLRPFSTSSPRRP